MNFSTPILVSLSSFGMAEVRRHGQLWCAQLCHAAGADGIEVRSELLRDIPDELTQLASLLRDTGMDCVYSSADPLWDKAGILDKLALQKGLSKAAALGAPTLKMSIGGFREASSGSFPILDEQLRHHGCTLLIENDQTVSAGSLDALQQFFALSEKGGLNLGMTFDVGNWHWVGECPLHAAHTLAQRVRYVHCKGVQRQPARWIAVPLQDSLAPWRSLLRLMPADIPHAIEYPLMGDDLQAVARTAIQNLRTLRGAL